MTRRLVRALLPLLLVPSTFGVALAPSVRAQIVPVRTVPVASGDQFLLYPSETIGMGGVSIAVQDSLADAWSQPAKGVFIRESAFLGSPTFYSISDRGGAGKTFPVAGLFHGDSWFGGASLALQQIENDNGRGQFLDDPFAVWSGGVTRLRDLSSRNLYTSGFFGRRLGPEWSFGLGASTARLDALDGVDLLYAGAQRIEQSGNLSDVRLGFYRDGESDRLSLSLIHNRISMTHDVTYVDVMWVDSLQRPVADVRTEVNEDKTRTWGLRAEWDRDLTAPGWRFGTTATVNRKSHPKIPNYALQNIPRDPGTTWAYEVGVGISRKRDGTTFGLDVILQPIWSETWQEADARILSSDGKTIEVGERTIDNDFFFTNVILRTGLTHEMKGVDFQAGLEVRSYDYELEQIDHIAGTFRDQRESWMEWTPSIGAVFHFSDLDLRYAGRLTTGTGRPGLAGRFEDSVGAPASGGDFIIAPQSPLTLQDASVVTHQLSVRIPIR